MGRWGSGRGGEGRYEVGVNDHLSMMELQQRAGMKLVLITELQERAGMKMV